MTELSKKNWLFVCNDYTDDDIMLLSSQTETDGILYLIFGKEVSLWAGPIIQGVICFETEKTCEEVNEVFMSRFPVFPVYVSVPMAISYAKKEGEWSEFGTFPQDE